METLGTQTQGEAYVTERLRPLSAHYKLVEYANVGGRVLDVGCSSGDLARRLHERGNTVVGIDLDPAAAEAAAPWCEVTFSGDIETMDLPLEAGSFDAVMCGDLIEHLRDPIRFMAKLQPLLKPTGRLVVSTPNIANWSVRLNLLAGRFRYTDRGIMDRTHTHLFTQATLLEALAAAGFKVEILDHTSPVPGSSALLERISHKIASWRRPLFAYQFLVVARPTPA